VIVTTVSEPIIDVVDVKPTPMLIFIDEEFQLSITTPLPPLAPAASAVVAD
jgi:hypothetical protein